MRLLMRGFALSVRGDRMRVVIDRFEEGFAVLELYDGKKTVKAPGELFAGAKEGDTVEINVLGKVKTGADCAHGITERLRKKSENA